MDFDVSGTLRREFANRSEAAAFQRLQQQQRTERDRRDRKEDSENDSAELLDFALAVISETEALEFRLELDQYDAATVASLQENERALEHVQVRMEELLAKAYVLPDGRRVFKTEDGSRVFDEFGRELAEGEIDPAMIEDARPSWEDFKSEFEEKQRLMAERNEILAYQARLDEARERLDAGDMTREEFDELREDLKADMPEAVRDQIPELAAEQKAEAVAAAPAIELDMSDDMVPDSAKMLAPSPL